MEKLKRSLGSYIVPLLSIILALSHIHITEPTRRTPNS